MSNLKHIPYFLDSSIDKSFGFLSNGHTIYSFKLSNKNGMEVEVINFGATVTAIKIPTANGKLVDVVLGFDNLKAYVDSFSLKSAPYLGATVGRFAGRINNGNFKINDETIQLNKNNGNHSLHGGNIGFSQKTWNVKNRISGNNPSITFSYTSPDLEEFFPGELTVDITYTLSEDNELIIDYKATSDKDTIVNLTHHSYFNLDGHDGSIVDQDLYVNASKILQLDNENIPTGRYIDVVETNFDYTEAQKCPTSIDNTFVLDQPNQLAASLTSSKNNITMNVFTNQPAVHIYVGGNCFNEIKGKDNADYHTKSGICFETQNFPDAPNHGNFPNAILKKNELYTHKTIYQFKAI